MLDSSMSISIHTLRMERDDEERPGRVRRVLFQSTRSAWSVTQDYINKNTVKKEFQSTRSAWSVTLHRLAGLKLYADFNPHAPHGA